MKRPVIYDVNQKKPAIASGHSDKIKETKNNHDSWTLEKRKRAMKVIHNASVLSDIVKSIEHLNLSDPNKDGLVIKAAVEKISTIIEEMKQEFKKDYWE